MYGIFRQAIDVRTLLSGLAFVALFALLQGFTAAIALLLVILVHELGHALFLARLGKPVPRILFIPLLGGVTVHRGQPLTLREQAWFAYGGPFIGTLVALLCWQLFVQTRIPFLFLLAYWGLLLNLFNLLPLGPLDGGKIASAIDRRIWWLGAALVLGLFLFRPSPILGLVLLASLWEIYRQRRRPAPLRCPRCQTGNRVAGHGANQRPVCGRCGFPLGISPPERLRLTLAYLGLLAGQLGMLVLLSRITSYNVCYTKLLR